MSTKVFVAAMKEKRQRKGVGVQRLVWWVSVLIGIALLFQFGISFLPNMVEPLQKTFLTHLLGSAGGILHLDVCDYLNSGTNEKVYFCWGLKCARLNKMGPDFKPGETRDYNIAMKEDEIEDFYFILTSETLTFEEFGGDVAETFTDPWARVLHGEGLKEKTLGSLLTAYRKGKDVLIDVKDTMATWAKGLSGQQCLCIEGWRLEYHGRTIINVTYEPEYVLWKGAGGRFTQLFNTEIHADQFPPITCPIEPSPDLIPKQVTRKGNLDASHKGNEPIDCKNYENYEETLSCAN